MVFGLFGGQPEEARELATKVPDKNLGKGADAMVYDKETNRYLFTGDEGGIDAAREKAKLEMEIAKAPPPPPSRGNDAAPPTVQIGEKKILAIGSLRVSHSTGALPGSLGGAFKPLGPMTPFNPVPPPNRTDSNTHDDNNHPEPHRRGSSGLSYPETHDSGYHIPSRGPSRGSSWREEDPENAHAPFPMRGQDSAHYHRGQERNRGFSEDQTRDLRHPEHVPRSIESHHVPSDYHPGYHRQGSAGSSTRRPSGSSVGDRDGPAIPAQPPMKSFKVPRNQRVGERIRFDDTYSNPPITRAASAVPMPNSTESERQPSAHSRRRSSSVPRPTPDAGPIEEMATVPVSPSRLGPRVRSTQSLNATSTQRRPPTVDTERISGLKAAMESARQTIDGRAGVRNEQSQLLELNFTRFATQLQSTRAASIYSAQSSPMRGPRAPDSWQLPLSRGVESDVEGNIGLRLRPPSGPPDRPQCLVERHDAAPSVDTNQVMETEVKIKDLEKKITEMNEEMDHLRQQIEKQRDRTSKYKEQKRIYKRRWGEATEFFNGLAVWKEDTHTIRSNWSHTLASLRTQLEYRFPEFSSDETLQSIWSVTTKLDEDFNSCFDEGWSDISKLLLSITESHNQADCGPHKKMEG